MVPSKPVRLPEAKERPGNDKRAVNELRQACREILLKPASVLPNPEEWLAAYTVEGALDPFKRASFAMRAGVQEPDYKRLSVLVTPDDESLCVSGENAPVFLAKHRGSRGEDLAVRVDPNSLAVDHSYLGRRSLAFRPSGNNSDRRVSMTQSGIASLLQEDGDAQGCESKVMCTYDQNGRLEVVDLACGTPSVFVDGIRYRVTVALPERAIGTEKTLKAIKAVLQNAEILYTANVALSGRMGGASVLRDMLTRELLKDGVLQVSSVRGGIVKIFLASVVVPFETMKRHELRHPLCRAHFQLTRSNITDVFRGYLESWYEGAAKPEKSRKKRKK